MNSLPKITEADISARVTDISFQRGYDYYRSGAVLEITRRGNRIMAEVEGSSYDPYQVSVTLSERGIEDANCTCPYDWGGYCKHIVAVLLTYIRSQEEIEELPSVETMLSDLDSDQLRALILALVDFEPSLADVIQGQISEIQLKASSDSESTLPRERRTQLDSDSFHHQVRAALHSLDRVRQSDAYRYVGDMVQNLYEVLEKARTFVEANDGRNAIIILEALTEEIIDALDSAFDPDGELVYIFDDMKHVWTEAFLVADLTPDEREEWANRMDVWESKLSGYYIDDVFSAAQAAVIQGWDYPPLQRVLNGKVTSLGAWEEDAPWFADDLAVARLNVLARQGRTQEYLYLAEAEGQMERYLTMLAQLGRVQEAVDNGLKYID